MIVVVTGAAGFIGAHVAQALGREGAAVIGVDNLNTYYDVSLKRARLAALAAGRHFTFVHADIADPDAIAPLFAANPGIDAVVHLAAQAGVRHSLSNPHAYIHSNVAGHVVVLEAALRLPRLRHLVYASSSSVYGNNAKRPFAVGDCTDHPASLYGATKKAMEVISDSYASSHGLPLTGLRFFTVYGPWGRPDMAYFSFTQRMLAGEPLPVFGQGTLRRDFTYIDDIVAGILASLERPPGADNGVPHRIFNLGNDHPQSVLDLIGCLERALGRSARLDLLPIPPGDSPDTHADISESRATLGFAPQMRLAQGIERFIAWYREYHRQ